MKKLKALFIANRVGLQYVLSKHWALIVLEIFFALLTGFAVYVTSWMTKSFTDTLLENQKLANALFVILLGAFFLFIKNVTQNLLRLYSKYVFSKTRLTCKVAFINHTKTINSAFFDIPENRSSFFRAEKYAVAGTEQLITHFFYCLSNVIASISILHLLTPFSMWIVLTLSLLMLYKVITDTIIANRDFKFKKRKATRDREIGYFDNLFNNSKNLADFNMYNAYDLFSQHFKDTFEENIKLQTKHDTFNSILTISSFITIIIQNVVLYGYAGYELLNGAITFGEFTMFFTATTYLNTLLINIKNSITPIAPMILEAQNYFEFINVDNTYKFTKPGTANTTITEIKKIEFRDVTFKYPQKNDYVLKDVSFTINAGDCVSLAGLNGSGKTTIIKLLLRFYEPTQGEILINDLPLQELNIKDYWKLCSTVFQNFSTYAVSALENISMKIEAETDIEKAKNELLRSGLGQRLETEQFGYNTVLSREFDPKGTVLSGGQQQQIAFSRANYKNSNLFILDEPSSALDASAEQDMFAYLTELKKDKNRIVLFVSHRLSTSLLADKIIFIKNAEVVGIGNHELMMKTCLDYADLFNTQARKYGAINQTIS